MVFEGKISVEKLGFGCAYTWLDMVSDSTVYSAGIIFYKNKCLTFVFALNAYILIVFCCCCCCLGTLYNCEALFLC